MWNMLIVIIIAIVIWMAGSQMNFGPKSTNSSIIKKETVAQIQNDADRQVKEARQLLKKEQEELNNNQQ